MPLPMVITGHSNHGGNSPPLRVSSRAKQGITVPIISPMLFMIGTVILSFFKTQLSHLRKWIVDGVREEETKRGRRKDCKISRVAG